MIDPTLVAFEDLFVGEPARSRPGSRPTVARLPVQVQRGFLIERSADGGRQARARIAQSWNKLLAMVKALYDAKVHLVLGTDHIGGLMLHHEMALFARAGIPNAAVLRMATLDAARAMSLDKQIGSIAAGKRADLFVVDGDPLANIDDRRGRQHDARAASCSPRSRSTSPSASAPYRK